MSLVSKYKFVVIIVILCIIVIVTYKDLLCIERNISYLSYLILSENKISCTIHIRDHFLVRFLPTVHRHKTASRYVCPSR